MYLPHHEAAPQPWTVHWSRHYCPFPVEWVKVEPGPHYPYYAEAVARIWALGEPFIVVEHDVVPWPGAVEQIAACPEPWCAYSHAAIDSDGKPGHVFARYGSVEMSCFKAAPDWFGIDSTFAQILFGRGHMVHQHFPGVCNLNGDYPVNPEPLRDRRGL